MLNWFATTLRGALLELWANAAGTNKHSVTSSATAARTLGLPDSSGFALEAITEGGARSSAFDPNIGVLTNMSVGREVLINAGVPTQLNATIRFNYKILKVEAFITTTDAGQTVGLSINGGAAAYSAPADAAGWVNCTQAPNTNGVANDTFTQVATGAAEGWIKVTLGERVP